MKQYVQHISGQGEKWEVYNENGEVYMCESARSTQGVYLPKSEYRLCDPPEVWRDVTSECRVEVIGAKMPAFIETGHFLTHDGCQIAKLICNGRYRWNNGKVEKKEP